MKLWCRSCGHYRHPRKEDGDYDYGSPGQCTLYPEWRAVQGEHFCGQYAGYAPAREANDQQTYERYERAENDYKARYRGALRRLKKANERIKALKGAHR